MTLIIQLMTESFSTLQVECLLANLIYRGAIKGYLHHRNKIMVVGKTGAFPKLSSIAHN
jgi:hypothetical protein